MTKKLRPGDIYTHCYSGLRHELTDDGKVNPGMIAGRKRGVIFDVGHGGGSFAWRVAVPMMQQGFLPDSISTDLHIGSMNSGMKDMLNVMGKFLAMGMSLDDVIAALHLESGEGDPPRGAGQSLGRLAGGCHGAAGGERQVRVYRYVRRADGRHGRNCTAELTLRDGKVVYDLNGISRPEWTTLPKGYTQTGDARWDAVTPGRRGGRTGSAEKISSDPFNSRRRSQLLPERIYLPDNPGI